jgi:hypothetical protein
MLKKFVLGFVFAVSGLLVWSCGDGSVDPLNDTELLAISRFPSTIDYDLLDSVVNACKKDKECWEKAKKTGEIYKGDYTKILRDDSGNIIIQEGDSAFVWKDGKKLPVFDFSSNSEGDDNDIGSSGSEITSGSSRIRSSGAGYDEDEYIDEYGPTSGGSGSGSGEVNHDRSSNSNGGSGVSSSIDLSFLSSSSSAKILSSTTVSHDDKSSSSKRSSSSVDTSVLSSSSSLKVVSSSSIHHERSSSSKTVVSVNSVAESSSSEEVVELSSSSATHHTGISSNAMACADGSLSGTCYGLPTPAYKNDPITYTFIPDANNTCNGYNEVEWNVTVDNIGASIRHEEHSYNAPQQKYEFVVSFSTVGEKDGVQFSMGGQNLGCDKVLIKRPCEDNTYTCTGNMVSATNNLWKNDVTYRWTFSQGASNCLDVSSVSWDNSGLTVNGNTATKTYVKGTENSVNETVTLTVVDELNENGRTVTCTPNAQAVYNPDLPPTCSVADVIKPVSTSFTVTPSSVTGCSYTDGNKCKYSLEDENGVAIASSSGGYTGGALPITGPDTDGEVEYTLTLENYLQDPRSCTFKVTYVTPIPVTLGYQGGYENFNAGSVYTITYTNSRGNLVCVGPGTVSCGNGNVSVGSYDTNVGSYSQCQIVSVSSGSLRCKNDW